MTPPSFKTMQKPRERIHREVLPNGLTILLEEMESVRSASLGFWVRSGSVDETEERSGVTHFIEHLLFKRTHNRTNRQIAQLIDQLGGDVDAFTSKEYTAFYARVEGRRVNIALELLTDIVRRPVFAPADLEKERKVILEEIAMVEDTPDDLVQETFIQKYWGGHPLGRPVLGTPATIGKIRVSHVEEIYKTRFVPKNLIFVAAGAFDAEKLAAEVRNRFGDLRGTSKNRALRAPKPRPHLSVKTKAEMEQIQILMGFDGPNTADPLRFACTILNVILGGGMSARLFNVLREKQGLVYTCGSFWSGFREAGYQCVFAASRKDNLRRVLSESLKVIQKVRKEGMNRSEIVRAKENVIASFLLGLESTASRMAGLARQEFHFGRVWTIDEIVDGIEAVSSDDLVRAADRLFRPETLSLTLLGSIDESPVSLEELRGVLTG